MSLIIKSITIYNENGEKRTLPFNESGLTIISGNSGTGKTSIADIVSYCLGGEFDVKGKIRGVIEWYGIHLQVNENEVFIARKSPPGSQASTNVCYFLVKKNIQIPEYGELTGKDNIESVTDFLSRNMGISSNTITPKPGSTLNAASPSLKHTLYYNFLKQSTIANEKILFHRQDEPFIPNYIKLTAPYFIGAIPEDQIIKKTELAELKKKLRQVISEIEENKNITGKGTLKGLSLVKEAESLDMVDVPKEPGNIDEVVDLLRSIKWDKLESIEKLPADALSKLYIERDKLVQAHDDLRNEYDIAIKFKSEQRGYSHESGEQSGRLQSIQLFKVFDQKNAECPSCGKQGIDFRGISNDLTKSFANLNTQIEFVTNTRAKLDKYIEDMREQVAAVKNKLQIVNTNIYTVTRENTDLLERRNLDQQKARIFGRVSLYVESLEARKDIGELLDRRAALLKRVQSLEEELSHSTTDEILESQLSFINKDMTDWSEELEMEYSGYEHRLNLNKLTVEAMTEKGPIGMLKMGSGKNWLACHLIAYFGLHKWFIENKRPVSSFLFLDQPSQVWFPSETSESANKDKDWHDVKNLYNWLYKTIDEIPGLQVILVDHVNFKDDTYFKSKLKEVWRDGMALVPYSWLK